MKLLMVMSPTVFFAVYGQLITKWRVEAMLSGMTGTPDNASRLLIYFKDPYIISAYLASFIASILWIFVVEKYDISNAFPIYIGLTVLLVVVGGVLFFKELMTIQRLVAILLIVLGVAISSKG